MSQERVAGGVYLAGPEVGAGEIRLVWSRPRIPL